MSASQEAANELARQMRLMQEANPAGGEPVARRSERIPMSIPRRRLAVPDLPGFYLYWFKEENVPRAMDAGYEFVDPREVNVTPTNVGMDNDVSGNTDLGTRVSMITGTTVAGVPMRAYLMKLREEWHNEDEAAKLRRNMQIMEAVFGDEANQVFDEHGRVVGASGSVYTRNPFGRTGHEPLLNRPTRKAVIGRRASRR